MAGPVPLVLCGKSSMMASSFMKGLDGADYQVIHACHTLEAAKTEIPSLLRQHPFTPASDLSTILASDPSTLRMPKAIIIGKGFSQAEMDEVIAAGEEAARGKVAWLVPDDDKFTAYMKAKALVSAGTMLPTVIADRVRACLEEHNIAPGEKDVEVGVWGF